MNNKEKPKDWKELLPSYHHAPIDCDKVFRKDDVYAVIEALMALIRRDIAWAPNHSEPFGELEVAWVEPEDTRLQRIYNAIKEALESK